MIYGPSHALQDRDQIMGTLLRLVATQACESAIFTDYYLSMSSSPCLMIGQLFLQANPGRLHDSGSKRKHCGILCDDLGCGFASSVPRPHLDAGDKRIGL